RGKDASTLAREAIVLAPKLGRVVAAKAVVDLAGGAPDGALGLLEGLTGERSRCRDAYLYYLKGHAQYSQGKFADAAGSFARAAELVHSRKGVAWADGYLAAGAAALKARRYPEAARHYKAAVGIDGGSVAAHAGLGLAYLGQVGRDEDADRELRRAMAIDANCLEAHLGLGFLANRHRRETEAIKYFERARGLAGGSRYAAEALEKLRAGRGESIEFFGFDGAGLPTGWVPDQRYGVMIEAKGGQLSFSGKQKQVGGRETRFYVRQDARKFVRLEIDVVAAPTGGTVCGLFLAGTRGFLEIGMFENGKLAWRMKNRGGYSAPADVRDWPVGAGGAPGKVRLGIQILDAGQGRFRLFADGLPVKDVVVDTLAGAQGFQVGAFCRAQLDEAVDLRMDNASLVTRKQ
ncbi:MAG: tetratricopeptide repeat protein, partial [Planctomycetota bacterium]